MSYPLTNIARCTIRLGLQASALGGRRREPNQDTPVVVALRS